MKAHTHKTGVNGKTRCGLDTTGRRKHTDDDALVTCPDCLGAPAPVVQVEHKKDSANQLSLQKLLEDGVLVSMHVFGTNLFNTSHTWEELGLDSSKSSKRYKHGRRILAADANTRLHNWGLTCRRLPAEFTVPLEAVNRLMGSANWRWMPLTSLPAFEDEFSKLINQKDLIVADILQNLDRYRDEASSYYRVEAEAAWTSFFARYGQAAVMVTRTGRTFDSTQRDEYVDWVVDSVLGAFPTEQQVLDCVRANFEVFYPFTDADKLEEEARQAKARSTLSLEQALVDRAKLAIANTKDPIQELLEGALASMVELIKEATESISNGKHVNWRLADKLKGAHEIWGVLGGRQLQNTADVEAMLDDLSRYLDSQPTLGSATALATLDKLSAIRGTLDAELAKVRAELSRDVNSEPLDDSVADALLQMGVLLGSFDEYPRIRGLLKGLAPGKHREHSLLLQAFVERVPADLIRMQHSIPEVILKAQMVARMRSAFATEEAAASWAVDAWLKAVRA